MWHPQWRKQTTLAVVALMVALAGRAAETPPAGSEEPETAGASAPAAVEKPAVDAVPVEDLLAEAENLRSATPSDWSAAVERYRRAAEQGSSAAQTALGRIELEGRLGAADFWAARRWFEAAAEAGDPEAQRELGLLLRDGKCGERLPAQGFEWLERAARTGDGPAQTEVGWMLWGGQGIEADLEEAADWFKLASEHGEPRAQAYLGYFYAEGLGGLPKDGERAFGLLLAAARQRDERGIGATMSSVLRETPRARRAELVERVQAVLDEPDVMSLAGGLPEFGLEILEQAGDEARARAWCAQLVAAHRPQSNVFLAWRAFTAWHMPYNLEVARARLRVAASRYPADSVRLLATIDSIAHADTAVRAAARETLIGMARGGDVPAAFTLAERAMTGVGEELDPALAKYYHGLAAGTRNPKESTLLDFEAWAKMYHPPAQPAGAELEALLSAAKKKQKPGPDAQPVPAHIFQPVYPFDLRRSGLTGEALIEFVVDAQGFARDVHPVRSTHPLFAAAAVGAVKCWRFAPGQKDGRVVNTRMQQPIMFSLEEEAKGAAESAPPPEGRW